MQMETQCNNSPPQDNQVFPGVNDGQSDKVQNNPRGYPKKSPPFGKVLVVFLLFSP